MAQRERELPAATFIGDEPAGTGLRPDRSERAGRTSSETRRVFALCEAIEDGRLITLLEDYRGETSPISAVYLEGRTLPHKLRTLIDIAQEDVRRARVL